MKNEMNKASNKKLMGKKYLLPIAVITIIVALCSSLSLAWIAANTNEINNKFDMQTASIEVKEDWDPNECIKENVGVTNTGEATVFVRVALAEQRMITNANSNETIQPNTSNESYFNVEGFNNTDWVRIGDYYYYKYPLQANATTTNIFQKATPAYKLASDEQVILNVMAQAIQANAAEEVWGVKVDGDGNIAQGGKN